MARHGLMIRNMDYLQEISTLLGVKLRGNMKMIMMTKNDNYDHDDHDVLHKSLIKSLIFIFFGECGPHLLNHRFA